MKKTLIILLGSLYVAQSVHAKGNPSDEHYCTMITRFVDAMICSIAVFSGQTTESFARGLSFVAGPEIRLEQTTGAAVVPKKESMAVHLVRETDSPQWDGSPGHRLSEGQIE